MARASPSLGIPLGGSFDRETSRARASVLRGGKQQPFSRETSALRGDPNCENLHGPTGVWKKEKTNKPWIRRVALLEWWVLNFTFARLFPFLTGARSKAAGLFIVERAASRPRLPLNAAAKGEALMTPGKPPAVVPLSQSASSPPALNERTSPLRFFFQVFFYSLRDVVSWSLKSRVNLDGSRPVVLPTTSFVFFLFGRFLGA